MVRRLSVHMHRIRHTLRHVCVHCVCICIRISSCVCVCLLTTTMSVLVERCDHARSYTQQATSSSRISCGGIPRVKSSGRQAQHRLIIGVLLDIASAFKVRAQVRLCLQAKLRSRARSQNHNSCICIGRTCSCSSRGKSSQTLENRGRRPQIAFKVTRWTPTNVTSVTSYLTR